MSDLGYQSNAQAGLTPCYNDLASYTDSLRAAVDTVIAALQLAVPVDRKSVV